MQEHSNSGRGVRGRGAAASLYNFLAGLMLPSPYNTTQQPSAHEPPPPAQTQQYLNKMADAAQQIDAGAMQVLAVLAQAAWEAIRNAHLKGRLEEYWCCEYRGTETELHSHPESVPHECTRGGYEAMMASRYRRGLPFCPSVEYAYDPSNDITHTVLWQAESFKRPS
jgi:hypothetical protein